MSKTALITGITGQDGAYDPAKAKLGWSTTVGFQELASEMVRADLETTKREGRPDS